MKIMGIDIGGTKVEASIFEVLKTESNATIPIFYKNQESYLRLINKKRIPTNRDEGYQSLVDRIASLCLDLTPSINEISGIGIGLPGSLDPQTHIMTNGNTAILIGKPFKQDLMKKINYQKQMICANDANCFALAEVMSGAGLKYQKETGIKPGEQSAIGIILGTGCGGGIIHQGQILTGHHGSGGEIGHYCLVYKGRDCYCNNIGCAEQYLSGSGLENSYYEETNDKISAKEIFELSKKNEGQAKKVIAAYKDYLVQFLTDLANIFDPHYFVLGGGVSLQSEIYKDIEKLTNNKSFAPNSKVRVYQHVLGDSAGGIGAALLI